MPKRSEIVTQIPEPRISKLAFADTRLGWVWFIIRIYIGYEWLVAGWAKVNNPMWVGSNAGGALTGFLMGALKKTAGPHPDVSGW